MPEIFLHDRARKSLERLDARTRSRVIRALEKTVAEPRGSAHLSPLHGELSGLHRLRVGELRVVMEFDRDQNSVYVHAIGPRGDIYK